MRISRIIGGQVFQSLLFFLLRYTNVTSMLPFEESVMRYLEQTENHVLYRVTPYFKNSELLARGVEIEAYSVEDNGKGICFNVFVYN